MRKHMVAAIFFSLPAPSGADPTKTAALAVNNLALDLLVHAAKPEENTALSPYSIQMALVMAYAGAEGKPAGKWPGSCIIHPTMETS